MTAKKDGSMFQAIRSASVAFAESLCTAGVLFAQEVPSDYPDVLQLLVLKGDFMQQKNVLGY